MRGRTNSSGITVKKNFATIYITYPEGSSCEATNGSKTLVDVDQSGDWVIKIPTPKELPETWTITATDGKFTKGAEVVINAEGQVEEVNISYRKYIYKSNSGFEDGYSAKLMAGSHSEALGGAQYLEIKADWSGDVAFVGDIKAGDYSTVNMTIVQTGGSSGVIFALQDKQATGGVLFDYMLEALATAVAPVGCINEVYTLTIPLTGIDTSQPLYLYSMHYNRPTRIYDVWLE